jgi:hypothetical protein
MMAASDVKFWPTSTEQVVLFSWPNWSTATTSTKFMPKPIDTPAW